MKNKLLLLFAGLLIAGSAVAQTGSVEVRDAWARATPAKAEDSTAYLTVQSPVADRLTGASTPVASSATLHEMTMSGSMMRMRPVDGLDLPPGQPVTLKPNGVHIMLRGLKAPLETGQSFPLTLHFAKAGDREINVTVEKFAASGPEKAGGDMKMPMPAGR